MTRELARRVTGRARRQCEYCRLPQLAVPLPFQIDHIVAEKHGGQTDQENLALACVHCNLYKGPNIAGLDPDSGQLVRLFHPRIDQWHEHFEFNAARIIGKTPIGRATVQVLAMNAEDLVRLRVELLREGATLL